MKYVIRIILLIVIGLLAYFTFESIAGPVRYEKEVQIKEQAVINKLKIIREGEMAYKDVYKHFTGSFDTLIDFMKNGKLEIVKAFGDQDDSTSVYREEIMYVSVKDSLFQNVNLDNIRYVPGSDSKEFDLEAGVITKNSVQVPVFQATDPDPFDKARVKENNPLRVGSMYDVDYSGNWGNR